MITDTIVYIDSLLYPEAQYQPGDELYVCCTNGKDILVFNVSEKTYNQLYKDASHEHIIEILRSHRYQYC